nr:calmodulin-2/4 isoform X2 [Hydra vulgaris]
MDGDQMQLDSLNHEHQEGGIRAALMIIQKHGYITPKQVHSFFTDMGETYTQKEVNKLIYELDIRDRDTLDLREFLTLIQLQLKVNDTEEEVIEAFKVFDKDQSGFLECSELRRIMVNLGDKLTDDEVDAVIVKSDIDGDGSCNYEVHDSQISSTQLTVPTLAMTTLVPWHFELIVQNFTYHTKCLIDTAIFTFIFCFFFIS